MQSSPMSEYPGYRQLCQELEPRLNFRLCVTWMQLAGQIEMEVIGAVLIAIAHTGKCVHDKTKAFERIVYLVPTRGVVMVHVAQILDIVITTQNALHVIGVSLSFSDRPLGV